MNSETIVWVLWLVDQSFCGLFDEYEFENDIETMVCLHRIFFCKNSREILETVIRCYILSSDFEFRGHPSYIAHGLKLKNIWKACERLSFFWHFFVFDAIYFLHLQMQVARLWSTPFCLGNMFLHSGREFRK